MYSFLWMLFFGWISLWGRREVVLMGGGKDCQLDWSPRASGGRAYLREKSGGSGCIPYGFCLCEVDIISVLLLKYLWLARETNKADLSQLTTSQAKMWSLKFGLFNLNLVHAISLCKEFFSSFAERVKKTMLSCLPFCDNWGVGKPRVRVIRPGSRASSLERSKWNGDVAKPGGGNGFIPGLQPSWKCL